MFKNLYAFYNIFEARQYLLDQKYNNKAIL